LNQHGIRFHSGIEGDIFTNNENVNSEFISVLEVILPSCAGKFIRSEKKQMNCITWKRYLPPAYDSSNSDEELSSRSEEVDMPSVIAYYHNHLSTME
jgi:hypothetical protein